jgi:hypothetical protein
VWSFSDLGPRAGDVSLTPVSDIVGPTTHVRKVPARFGSRAPHSITALIVGAGSGF